MEGRGAQNYYFTSDKEYYLKEGKRMGDTSILARRLKNGHVQFGWSGNGGYCRNTGVRLLLWYQEPEDVEYLFSLGQTGLIGEKGSEKGGHEWYKTHDLMPAYIGSIGMFNDTRTIFASPVMNDSMYQFQRELHKCLQDFDTTGWEWYCPNSWVPHCTLALTKEDDEEVFYKASDLILHEFRKISGKFVSVGLVKISFPVEEIYTIELDS